MTIAACLLTPGGVVLGADSTQTVIMQDATGRFSTHYFNHAQKLFEVGDPDSCLGIVTWGIGGWTGMSYRKLIADVGDAILASGASTVHAAVEIFRDAFWQEYSRPTVPFVGDRLRIAQIAAISSPSPAEIEELTTLQNKLSVGFCMGGRTDADRTPAAFSIMFEPQNTSPPTPASIQPNLPQFWGVPNFMNRVVYGIDGDLMQAIARSPFWTGTDQDLYPLITPHVLRLATDLPIREAIDYLDSTEF